MGNNTFFKIDIDQILDNKAGSKARFVPGFVRTWLKGIAHQDEVNGFLESAGNKQGVPWLDAVMEFLDVTLDIHGMENLPDDADGKRFTFVSNHPLGGPDGIAIGQVLGHRYDGRIRYLVNDLLMNLHGLAPLCVPINKTGKQSRDFPRLVEAAFGSDNHIIMFPAGLCSRRQQGVIRDLPWNKTFVTKSVETQRDVVPIYFSGRNSDRFYNLANFGKRLGLKFNIAMLYLADETFKNRHKTFSLHIGKPIPWQTFDRSRKPTEWAAWVQEQVYQLP
ncbi:MAG: glycerol acyltransferase [Bacteroidales bacterium]|nr:glycerol acyltransferase [Bacteroidales bacterium]